MRKQRNKEEIIIFSSKFNEEDVKNAIQQHGVEDAWRILNKRKNDEFDTLVSKLRASDIRFPHYVIVIPYIITDAADIRVYPNAEALLTKEYDSGADFVLATAHTFRYEGCYIRYADGRKIKIRTLTTVGETAYKTMLYSNQNVEEVKRNRYIGMNLYARKDLYIKNKAVLFKDGDADWVRRKTK